MLYVCEWLKAISQSCEKISNPSHSTGLVRFAHKNCSPEAFKLLLSYKITNTKFLKMVAQMHHNI